MWVLRSEGVRRKGTYRERERLWSEEEKKGIMMALKINIFKKSVLFGLFRVLSAFIC